MKAKNSASLARVQYADLGDIVKILNMKGGGSFMENVNEAQKLVTCWIQAGSAESRLRGLTESWPQRGGGMVQGWAR